MGLTQRSRSVQVFAAGAALAGLVSGASLAARAQSGPPSPTLLSFNRDIRPILSNNCFACHGPDEKKRETDFHFDTKEGMFLEEGIIVPGSAAKSVLVKKITEPDPKDRMPPPDSGHALTDTQIGLLKRWIDEGARWDTHWAYTAPSRPDVPSVRQTDWVRNPIDQFILARLEREGLPPSREADKTTLLRRLSYDLTGLPPTPAEIDAFLADKSPDAYEKRVDALLASAHYGERMAMPWLDAARYADTHGYHIDSLRGMWPWRDWVINAFNRNLPFDQFVIEQLAGDLLPDATREQKIASGFNRNHMINFEGGAIAEEYQVEYVIDRVEATSSAFMGLTMGCARCHSHKFDPITHKEFYQFFAFFNSVPEQGLDGRTGNAAPVLPLPSSAQQAQLDNLNAAIRTREAAIADDVVRPLQAEWERRMSETVTPIDGNGPAAHYELDGSFSDISGRYRHGRTIAGEPTFDPGQVGRAATFDGDVEVSFGNVGGFDRSEPFSLAVWLRGRGNLPMAGFQKFAGPDKRHGFEWMFDDIVLIDIQRWAARLNVAVVGETPASAIRLRTRERLTLGDWYHVVMSYDGSGKAAGLRLYLNGRLLMPEIVRDTLAGSTRSDAPLRVGSPSLGPPFRGQLDDLRLYTRVLAPAEVEQLALHYRARAVLSGVTGKRSRDEAAFLRDYFLTYAAPATLRTANAELRTLRLERTELQKTIPTAMVMAEMKMPRDTFVLARGDYRNQTEKVQPGVPSMLPPLPEGAPLNRLTLARWLVDPKHPLTGAGAPRAARLAGDRVHQDGLGHPRHAAPDRYVSNVSAGVDGHTRAARPRSRQPAAGAGPARPTAGRTGPRHRAGGERPAQCRDRRPQRSSLSAQGTLGRDGVRRRLFRAVVRPEPRSRSLSPGDVHVLEANRSARLARHLRRAGSGEVHRPAGTHEHASPGARADERSHLRRGGAGVRAAGHDRSRERRLGQAEPCVPAGHRAKADGPRSERAAPVAAAAPRRFSEGSAGRCEAHRGRRIAA
jgi:hypothetical protein